MKLSVLRLPLARLLVCAALLCSATTAYANQPRLIVQVTIDQLRGDLPRRFISRFGQNGFRYLLEQGTSFTAAHYKHSTTLTAVGHATLSTGGNAAQHGLVGNEWIDSESGKAVYCVEDEQYSIIGEESESHSGKSPRNLTSTTIGDELILAYGARPRVFSVSMKDRGAIIPGGHLGKAFWYNSNAGTFISSTYYYRQYPEWVERWNRTKPADRYLSQSWNLAHARSEYMAGERDERLFEKLYKHIGRKSPRVLKNVAPALYYAGLRVTPMGDEVTVDFVKTLVKEERLGVHGDVPDMLAISLSATDYIGHAFGPDSVEAEDNIIRLDRTLGDLFQFLDREIGLENILIVLSSDHGMAEAPEYMSSLRFGAGRLEPKVFLQIVNKALQKRLGIADDLIASFSFPSLYFNLEAIKKHKLDESALEQVVSEEMMSIPGIARAFSRTDLMAGLVPDDPIAVRVRAAFHHKRSGNVLVVQEPFWYLYDEPGEFSAVHGSPYTYDTYVPIMFAGPGIGRAQVVNRIVAPNDIAPTLAIYLGIKPPSGSVGAPLVEVFDRNDN